MDIKIKICVSELSLSQVLFPINHLRTAQMDLVTLLKDPTPHLKTGIRLKQQPGGLYVKEMCHAENQPNKPKHLWGMPPFTNVHLDNNHTMPLQGIMTLKYTSNYI